MNFLHQSSKKIYFELHNAINVIQSNGYFCFCDKTQSCENKYDRRFCPVC